MRIILSQDDVRRIVTDWGTKVGYEVTTVEIGEDGAYVVHTKNIDPIIRAVKKKRPEPPDLVE